MGIDITKWMKPVWERIAPKCIFGELRSVNRKENGQICDEEGGRMPKRQTFGKPTDFCEGFSGKRIRFMTEVKGEMKVVTLY